MGEVWTLRKGSRVAVCRLTTHPIGGDVRLEIDGEMLRTGAERVRLARLAALGHGRPAAVSLPHPL